jgi:cell division septal protein FtsQ
MAGARAQALPAPAAMPRPRRWRRLVLLLALVAALAAAYLLWFRDLPTFAIRSVEISGLTSSQAPQIEHDLERAARAMTTLHVDRGQLERAVRRYPVVADLRVRTDFPQRLRIGVRERPPGAVLEAPDGRTLPVAADGTALPGVAAGEVARIRVAELPGGARVSDGATALAVRVAAAAPQPLGAEIDSVEAVPGEPIAVRLRRGTEIRLGDGADLERKWAAAAAALADPEIAGAAYVDVTLPDRPVAGGL